MPADSEPKSTTDSSNSIQGLLSKCGLSIPFSVREEKASQKEASGPDMSPANSPDKKRKRTSQSPPSLSRRPIKIVESDAKPDQSSAMKRMSDATPEQDAFDQLLRDPKGSVRKYEQEHTRLLTDEDRGAWDYEVRRVASNAERRAAIIIKSLREFERKVIFGNNASEAIPGDDTLDMGGQFLTNKERIENRSKLYEISVEVPKGALLHLHFNAELHPERLLKEAQGMKNMYVWSKRALLTEEDLRETEVIFDVLPGFVNSTDIFSKAYKGTVEVGGQQIESWKTEKAHAQLQAQSQQCTIKAKDERAKCYICDDRDAPRSAYRAYMQWSEFQSTFGKKFGKNYKQSDEDKDAGGNRLPSEPQRVELSPAENWIKQKMVLSDFESYNPKQTVNGVWARFNQATRCFKGLLNYKKVYEWYIGAAIDRLIDEKIMYAELRPMLLDKNIPDTDGVGMLNLSQQMSLISECVERKLRDPEKREKFPFGLKIIYCTPRSIPKAKMQSEMRDCIGLKKKFPDLICGFDLVGAEDRPNHIGFYKEELIAFKETCRQQGLEIPFMFHAGETLLDTGGSADPKNSNLFDAVALQSKRIGHGFSLLKHPQLVKKFRKTRTNPGICIELCPISNELLHLCRNIKEHPYPELLAAGIPCCVNSDNPSLFDNSMSHEFYQIMVGAPTMSLHSWKQLAQWSLEYSCLSEAKGSGKSQKAMAQDIFMKSFEEFCVRIENDFGNLVDGNGQLVEQAVRAAYKKPDKPGDVQAEEARYAAFFPRVVGNGPKKG